MPFISLNSYFSHMLVSFAHFFRQSPARRRNPLSRSVGCHRTTRTPHLHRRHLRHQPAARSARLSRTRAAHLTLHAIVTQQYTRTNHLRHTFTTAHQSCVCAYDTAWHLRHHDHRCRHTERFHDTTTSEIAQLGAHCSG